MDSRVIVSTAALLAATSSLRAKPCRTRHLAPPVWSSLKAFEDRRALRTAAGWLRAISLEIDFVIITLLREKDVFHHLEARRTVKAAG